MHKLREIVHFVCGRLASPANGLRAEKLHATLWYLDVSAHSQTGTSVTGVDFTRGRFGPRSPEIDTAIEHLIDSGRLDANDPRSDPGFMVISSRGATDFSPFSDNELRFLDEACKGVHLNPAGVSMNERLYASIWQMAEPGESIPLMASAMRLESPSTASIDSIKKALDLA